MELARLDQLDQTALGIKVDAEEKDIRDSSSNVKREASANDGVHVKQESSASRKRPKLSGSIEAVDLTED